MHDDLTNEDTQWESNVNDIKCEQCLQELIGSASKPNLPMWPATMVLLPTSHGPAVLLRCHVNARIWVLHARATGRSKDRFQVFCEGQRHLCSQQRNKGELVSAEDNAGPSWQPHELKKWLEFCRMMVILDFISCMPVWYVDILFKVCGHFQLRNLILTFGWEQELLHSLSNFKIRVKMQSL